MRCFISYFTCIVLTSPAVHKNFYTSTDFPIWFWIILSQFHCNLNLNKWLNWEFELVLTCLFQFLHNCLIATVDILHCDWLHIILNVNIYKYVCALHVDMQQQRGKAVRQHDNLKKVIVLVNINMLSVKSNLIIGDEPYYSIMNRLYIISCCLKTWQRGDGHNWFAFESRFFKTSANWPKTMEVVHYIPALTQNGHLCLFWSLLASRL